MGAGPSTASRHDQVHSQWVGPTAATLGGFTTCQALSFQHVSLFHLNNLQKEMPLGRSIDR